MATFWIDQGSGNYQRCLAEGMLRSPLASITSCTEFSDVMSDSGPIKVFQYFIFGTVHSNMARHRCGVCEPEYLQTTVDRQHYLQIWLTDLILCATVEYSPVCDYVRVRLVCGLPEGCQGGICLLVCCKRGCICYYHCVLISCRLVLVLGVWEC